MLAEILLRESRKRKTASTELDTAWAIAVTFAVFGFDQVSASASQLGSTSVATSAAQALNYDEIRLGHWDQEELRIR